MATEKEEPVLYDTCCDVCGADHATELCPELNLDPIQTSNIKKTLSKARLSLPNYLDIEEQLDGCIRVIARDRIPAKTRFGPLEAKRTTQQFHIQNGFMLKVFGRGGPCTVTFDTSDEDECNWLCLVQTARTQSEQNCMAFQIASDLYYNTTREIQAGEEVRVWYAPHYAKKMGMCTLPDRKIKVLVSLKRTGSDNEVAEDEIPSSPPRGQILLEGSMLQPVTPDVNAVIPAIGEQVPGSAGNEGAATGSPVKEVLFDAENTAVFQCRRCTALLPSSVELAKHVQEHLKSYQCSMCTQRFFKKISLDRHAKLFHRIQQPKDQVIRKTLHVKALAEEVAQSEIGDGDGTKTTYIEFVNASPRRGRPRKSEDEKDGDYVPYTVGQTVQKHRYGTRGKRTDFKKLAGIRDRSASVEIPHDAEIEVLVQTGEPGQLTAEEESVIEALLSATSTGVKPGTSQSMETDGQDPQTKEGAGEETVIQVLEMASMETKPMVLVQDEQTEQVQVISADFVPVAPPGVFVESAESAQVVLSQSAPESTVGAPVEPVQVVPADSAQDAAVEPPQDETAPGVPAEQIPCAVLETDTPPETVMERETEAPMETEPEAPVVLTGSPTVAPIEAGPDASRETEPMEVATEAAESAPKETASDVATETVSVVPAEAPHESAEIASNVSVEIAPAVLTEAAPEAETAPAVLTETAPEAEAEPAVPDDADTPTEVQEEMMTDDVCRVEKLWTKGKFEDLIFKEKFLDGRFALYETKSGIRAYKCGFCEVCCTKLEAIEEHMSKHADKQMCENCRRFYDTQEQLDKHLCHRRLKNLSENRNGSYTCPDCGKLFKTRENLEAHYQGHAKNFNCKKCGKIFMRKETLEKHACSADDSPKKQTVQCDICAATFANPKYLFRHMTGHTNELTCTQCGKSFSRKQSLLQHLNKCNPGQLKDMDIDIFPCTRCPKVFSEDIKLQNHMVWHEGKFRCEHCGKQFSTQMTLMGHICLVGEEEEGLEAGDGDTGTEGFECTVCKKKFVKQNVLERHMLLHADNKLQCQLCKRHFGRKNDLDMHEIMCKGRFTIQEEGFVKCDVCNQEFFNVNEYFKHFLSHEKPYKCEKCARSFRTVLAVDQHLKTCQGQKGDTTCSVCGKTFLDMRYLERHMQLHQAPKYRCSKCSKTFHRKDYHANHICVNKDGAAVRMRRRRNNLMKEAEPHICHLCGKSYVSVGNLNKHMLRHGERQNVCPTCGKRFHLISSLKEHMKYVHTKRLDYQCPHCGKMLKSKNTVLAHIRQFHQENVLIYTCETCGKTFRQKGNLLKHQLMHIDHKTLQCPYCDRKFKYPEQLAKHKLEHEHGRRWICNECHKAFVKEYDLRNHVETFHSGKMYTCEFCGTDCRHSHTIRRHIRRRHPEKAHLLEDLEYVKGLLRNVEDRGGKPLIAQVMEEAAIIADEAVQTEEAVQTLQQFQTINIDGTEIQSININGTEVQTININGTEVQVIEEDPNNTDVAAIIDNVMSHEAAEVLQSLASNNTQESNVTVAAFTDIPQFTVDGTATHVIHQDAETQEYILVPLIQNNEK